MPDSRFIAVLSLLLVLMGGLPVEAQSPPQNIQKDADKGTTVQPVGPKPVVNITLDNDRLSVELVDANMGEIIQAIAHKAGFSVEGDSAALSKKLTTRFNNLDVDRGIARLFSLAKENNYLINYDSKGAVSKLEIYGAAVSSSAAKTPPATPPASTARRQVSPPAQPAATQPVITRPLPPSARQAPQFRPLRPAPQTPQPPQTPQTRQVPLAPQTPEPATPEPVVPPQTLQEGQNAGEDLPSEDVKEIPYVPPQRKPVFIPPIRR
jgi:hypothetical protein